MRARLLVPLSAAALILAGCAGSPGGPASAPSGPADVTTLPPAARSPIEGTWRTGRLTRAEFIRKYDVTGRGTDESGAVVTGPAFFRSLGGSAQRYAVTTIRFRAGQFAEFSSTGGGPAALGSTATYRVSGRTLTMMSPGPGSTVCTDVYAFTIRGRQLRMQDVKPCAERFDRPFGITLFASFLFTNGG